jgi:single-strand DNA-binding protein
MFSNANERLQMDTTRMPLDKSRTFAPSTNKNTMTMETTTMANTASATGTMLRNRVQLMGNLGRDPEMKEFEGGKRRVSFSIATTERWEFGPGNIKEDTQWHRVVCWAKVAEQAFQFLRKGAQISLEGRLIHRVYEDKEGQKKYITEVVMSTFQLIEKPAPVMMN